MNRRDRALEHRAANLGYGPDRLSNSSKKLTRLGAGRVGTEENPGVLSRLVRQLERPTSYVADAVLLGLPREAGEADAIYDHALVDSWRSALQLRFAAPWYAKLEVDKTGRAHAHVLAEANACCYELEGKPLESLERLARYLSKAPDDRVRLDDRSARLESEGLYLEARQRAKRNGKQMPRLSFSFGVPRK